mgnify:CR=1 FL=1
MEIFYLDEILEEIHKERTTIRGQKMEMMRVAELQKASERWKIIGRTGRN